MAEGKNASELSEQDRARLAEVLRAFLAAEVDGKRHLIETERELLFRPAAETMLRNAARNALDSRHEGRADSLLAHAGLLAACRERGAAAVFEDLRALDALASSTADLKPLLSKLQDLLKEASGHPTQSNFQRQIEICETILRTTPQANAPKLGGWLQRTKGYAMQRLGELTGNPAMLDQGAAAYREALKERTRKHSPMEWAAIQSDLAALLHSIGNLTGDASALRRAELCLSAALEEFTQKRAPLLWAATQNNFAAVLQSIGDLNDDAAALQRAELALRAALEEFTRERGPWDWANTQNNIGAVLARLGRLTGDASALRRADTALRAALEVRTREQAPLEWAASQYNLGVVLARLGRLTDDAVALRRAEQAYRAALEVQTRERAPLDWGTTENNLGSVLLSLGEMTGDAGVLQQAEHAYRAALEVRTREQAPLDWATTQYNLGIVLAGLGKLGGDASAMQRAEQAYCAALEVRTRQQAPTDWAATQYALGLALVQVGELTGDVSALRRSEQAFHYALEEFTRERAPADWAKTQNDLGNLLRSLAEQTRDVSALRGAEQAFRAALEVRTLERAPVDWAGTQNNLGTALLRLGELSGDASALREAEQIFRNALEVLTREEAPKVWALTQMNIAHVLLRQCRLTGDANPLRAAEQAVRAALEVHARQGSLVDWARTNNILGSVLRRLGELTRDASAFRLAGDAYRAALDVWSREGAPMLWAMTQYNLGGVLLRLGELSRDASTFEQAEQACRAALEAVSRERAPANWAMIQCGLGAALALAGEETRDASTLRKAEHAFSSALEEYTCEHARWHWAMTQSDLGNVKRCLAELTGDSALFQQAEQAYRLGLAGWDASDAEDDRQNLAGRLATLLIRAQRYGDATALIVPTLARGDAAIMDASRSTAGRTRSVEQVGDLYGLLSLCRLRQPEPDVFAALITAEAGRARLLADALNLDAARLDELNDLEVRTRIEAARDRRLSLRMQLGFGGVGSDDPRRELTSDERERLHAELQEASEAYFALCREHGLVRTLEPPTLPETAAAVPSGGALVLPVLTEREAFAFVVAGRGEMPAVVELPGLSRHEVVEHLSGEDHWLGAYGKYFYEHVGENAAAGSRWRSQLAGTMAWLWKRLLAPIHAHLRDVAKLERDAPVVLLPPGLLGLLPLHAAGPGPDGLVFGDHWTLSYAPSVRALHICQQRADERRDLPAELLAVLDPPSHSRLPGASAEGPMLARRFAHAQREPTILVDVEATLAAVLERLPTATCFHASTHGHHNPIQPTLSGLKMADGELTLEDLRHARLEAARLVFLSACESGLAGVRKLPEEFIGLPAGFVQAGAACVIGSLWPIRDDASFLLASRFYDEWLDARGRERAKPAQALRVAVDWLRRVTFAELKTMFAIEQGEGGHALVLRSGLRFEPASSGDQPQPIRLPLGPDNARPFEDPEFWAAFACTGA